MIAEGRPKAKAFAKNVFVNQERKSEDRRRLDTALVLTVNDANYQSASSFQLLAGGSTETKVFRFRGKYGCKAET